MTNFFHSHLALSQIFNNANFVFRFFHFEKALRSRNLVGTSERSSLKTIDLTGFSEHSQLNIFLFSLLLFSPISFRLPEVAGLK